MITWGEEETDDDGEIHDLFDDEDPDNQAGKPEYWAPGACRFLFIVVSFFFYQAFFKHWQDFNLSMKM